MAAGDADRRDHLGAQLVGELAKLFGLQPAEVDRGIDGVQQGGDGAVGQKRLLGPRHLRQAAGPVEQ